jgi:hypothetical protein
MMSVRLPFVAFSLLPLNLGSNRGMAPMTDDLQGQIVKARSELVEKRRSIIEALAKGYAENQIELLVKVQSAIDVLNAVEFEDEEEEDEEEED